MRYILVRRLNDTGDDAADEVPGVGIAIELSSLSIGGDLRMDFGIVKIVRLHEEQDIDIKTMRTINPRMVGWYRYVALLGRWTWMHFWYRKQQKATLS